MYLKPNKLKYKRFNIYFLLFYKSTCVGQGDMSYALFIQFIHLKTTTTAYAYEHTQMHRIQYNTYFVVERISIRFVCKPLCVHEFYFIFRLMFAFFVSLNIRQWLTYWAVAVVAVLLTLYLITTFYFEYKKNNSF